MTVHLTVKTGAALLALGLLRGDRVEALATVALTEGLDTPALRLLAGRPTGADDVELIILALRDLDVRLPSREDAARMLAKKMSSRIVNGELDPLEAAGELTYISWEVGRHFHELDPFVYAWSEAGSRPADREFFRRAIIDEAERWVQTGQGSVGRA